MRFHCKLKKIVQNCTLASACRSNIFVLALLLQCLLLQQQLLPAQAGSVAAKGFLPQTASSRMRSAKIASIHQLQAAAESLPPPPTAKKDKKSTAAAEEETTANNVVAGKYEIHTVSGEPNYKSVNLTWEVEFVPSAAAVSNAAAPIDAVTNSSAEVEPPKAFQIFFCELQSFGPHRCRSKLVDEQRQYVTAAAAVTAGDGFGAEEETSRQVRHYAVQIDNLRMATKYSFHIRPQQKRRNMKITGRSEMFGNEIEDENGNSVNLGGQTIVIPTKGFSAEATKCLPHASEIEVETGPYFGGKIVVDGGNCGVKGNADDPVDKYTMRIDHKMCGSMVKPETNTVETFITVQENLGIFTHSTRRFVVVCSFQSGMQTVRASFRVPGKGGVASAVINDPFEADDRLGRELRDMHYVDKSGLVLKEEKEEIETVAEDTATDTDTDTDPDSTTASDESEMAVVEELLPETAEDESVSVEHKELDSSDAVAILEDIIPGINELDIKHENEVVEPRGRNEDVAAVPVMHARLAKYAKLVVDRPEHYDGDSWFNLAGAARPQGRAFASSLHYISANLGSVVLAVALAVIIIGAFMFVIYREARRQVVLKARCSMQQRLEQHKHLQNKTLPRALQQQHQGTM